MRSKRRLYLTVMAILVVVMALWLSTSLAQTRRRYEVEAQVYSTPEYRTDATRAIDAYERVMERYMDATERNLAGVSADIGAVAVMLENIDAKLAKLDTRMERIERHLGILPPPPPPAPTPDPNANPVPPRGSSPYGPPR